MDDLDRRIVNGLQGGFPITEYPFADAARAFAISEAALIARIDRLRREGWLTRFGPMFNADRLGGGTTLAAMVVPDGEFDRVAAIVNAFPEIAHNYQREHALNMWFVIATEIPERIAEVVTAIEQATGFAVYSMPKLEEFFVEAKFAA